LVVVSQTDYTGVLVSSATQANTPPELTVTGVALRSIFDVITFGLDWLHLHSNSARGNILDQSEWVNSPVSIY